MKVLMYKVLCIVANIAFIYAISMANLVSANHMHEIKEPTELMKHKK